MNSASAAEAAAGSRQQREHRDGSAADCRAARCQQLCSGSTRCSAQRITHLCGLGLGGSCSCSLSSWGVWHAKHLCWLCSCSRLQGCWLEAGEQGLQDGDRLLRLVQSALVGIHVLVCVAGLEVQLRCSPAAGLHTGRAGQRNAAESKVFLAEVSSSYAWSRAPLWASMCECAWLALKCSSAARLLQACTCARRVQHGAIASQVYVE